jgi:hypothetical protein
LDPRGAQEERKGRSGAGEENKALVRREQAELWNHTPFIS